MKKKIEEKKRKERKSALSHVLWKGEAELLDDRAYDYGCNSGIPLRDAVGSF